MNQIKGKCDMYIYFRSRNLYLVRVYVNKQFELENRVCEIAAILSQCFKYRELTTGILYHKGNHF